MTTPDNGNRPEDPPEFARYSRQMLVDGIGVAGQRRVSRSSVLLVGCGALGSIAADVLVRAGVGRLRICDRDFIEPNNLQRQVLFDEDDIAADLPKAEAAARKLARANPQTGLEAVVADVTHATIERLADGVHLILDGTDNFETRYLINDYAVSAGVPWVYAAVIATTGMCMTVIPGHTACLRCVFEEPPPAELSPSCETAGVLAPAAHVVAGFQTAEALKILTGNAESRLEGLLQFDVWTGRVVSLSVARATEGDACPCCVLRDFPFLEGRRASRTVTLCGRNAVQITPPRIDPLDLATVADRLGRAGGGSVRSNSFLVRAIVERCELTCFADGRLIIKGTTDADRARSLYAKYIGT